MTKALLIVDHGSKRQEANDMIFDVVSLLEGLSPELIIEASHMELAEPTIEEGIHACVQRGATEIVVQPYMLSPGRHSTSDIPRMVKEISEQYLNISIRVSSHLGVHTKIAEVLLEKADL
ncbi:cobalamin biosynthesis protein CbiX [Candidatus Marinamargulisbacteria bacterium SCGC AG-343-D04]|nr:cobalamin biosynthesis protein CbiX [Candidatus Marinamargulisbacteria bacterium SCGC AG-343-D04]